MPAQTQSDPSSVPWKWIALGLAAVMGTALVTGTVVANYASRSNPPTQAAAAPAPPKVVRSAGDAPREQASTRPSLAAIEECNRYVDSDKTTDTLKSALIGAAGGAGLGAAGGAIAGGGRGAGKGAGIGGLVGAAAGTLYGLNESKKKEAGAEVAYRDCMRRRGYTD